MESRLYEISYHQIVISPVFGPSLNLVGIDGSFAGIQRREPVIILIASYHPREINKTASLFLRLNDKIMVCIILVSDVETHTFHQRYPGEGGRC